jgi:hypothetical protein
MIIPFDETLCFRDDFGLTCIARLPKPTALRRRRDPIQAELR